ncbi:tetratricopeptide repeat protein [Candidatus Fermentibacteria bacterium]|nr:tetratricopeptide repeat protein [Candidatus Fermentibacteria bacterium]
MTSTANTSILLGLLAIVLLILMLLRVDQRRKRRQRQRAYPEYVEGLHLLLRGRKDAAARAFRAAIESGPYALEARLRLGDLLRARGAVEQAARLHESLLSFPSIPVALRRDAALALADDHKAAGKSEASIDAIQRAVTAIGNDEMLLQRLLQALEENGRWDRAMDAARTLEKMSARSVKPRAALYRVERAREALASGNLRRARADLRKALVEDPKCGPARLLTGDAFFQEGDLDKAVAEWLRLAEDVPELASLAYSRIEPALYDSGDYGRILAIYNSILQKRPGDVETLCRLARHDERIGSLEKAVERAHQASESAPGTIYPRSIMAAYLCDLNRPKPAGILCREIAQQAQSEVYRCPHCGITGPDFAWRCPSCLRIGSFVRSKSG